MINLIIKNNTKAIKQQLLLYCFCVIHFFSFAQLSTHNLVQNPSFELYNFCPYENSLYVAFNSKPDYWYKPDKRGARYYNSCANNNTTSMPYNFGGGGYNYQYAKTGNGYILMYYYAPPAGFRDYIQIKLIDSLSKSKCYYAEYYVNLYNTTQIACNNQSILFTNNPVYVDTNALPAVYILPANPQIQNPFVVTDTLNWVKIAGVFTAQGGEQYLTLGNFKNDAQTTTQQIQALGASNCAYYIEDVTVVPLDSITLKADAGLDKTIIAGDSAFVGSFTTGLTSVNWYNSSGNIIATNVSGLFVKPTASTFYVIEQTVCGQYSRDTVYVNVGAVPLVIKNYELKIKNEGVENNWQTLQEINVSHFNIQFSVNGKDFVTVGKVAAQNKAVNQYQFSHYPTSNLQHPTLYYRIEGVDKDGKLTYSKTLNILITHDSPLTIYPNPAKETISVSFPKIKQVIVSDITGKTIKNINLQYVNFTSIPVSDLQKGIYVVKVIGANGNAVEKLVVE